MADVIVAKKKLPVLKFGLALVVAGGVAVFLLRGVDGRAAIVAGMEIIRGAGPVVFFAAMALLPAVGVPGLTFSLTAGPAFGERLGMGVVVALSLAATTVNLIITYALARRALRPLLEKWLTRLGYQLPEVEAGDMTDLAIVVRVTPGIPFFAQNYLLGLAGVPFGKYVVVSCVTTWIYTTAFVLFGDALLHGKGKVAMLAGSLLVLAVAATHWARKHYGKKRAPAA